MAFTPRETKKKVKAGYKTIYIKDEPAKKVEKLAAKHETSFNNIVISILEDFFNSDEI